MVEGSLANIEGCDCYRIDGVDQMEPFLVSVVSSSDLWMFASSRGPLTAGRTDADRAFLPYETDDRIHRAVHITGPVTIVTRDVDGVREVWRPFGPAEMAEGRRSLAKSVIGDRLIFEETHAGWGVTYRATWMPSPSFGWVRRVQLIDDGGSGSTLEVVDGLLDVMPPAVEAGLEQMRSNLVDAYKRSETGRWGTAAIYTLESLISDRAEPGEALSANVIWSQGAPDFEVHLDERVLDAAVGGRAFPPSELLTGRRGAYLLRGPVELPPGGSVDWTIVADVDLSHAEIVDRLRAVGSNETLGQLESDIRSGSQRLGELLAASDAMQDTGDPIADAHHLSNVLFNVMRGGLFPHESQIPMADYLRHLESWNSPVHERHAQALGRLGDWADATELGSIVEASADDHLTRLTLEYLPLAFSRRHGDPSRPWNRFSINVRGDDGEDLLGYEGNWRDIFQNWEALLVSHPQFVANVVAKFVNASTIDGHNPYRITHTGVDWEVPDPHDPWANIGYWGDHQIVYLHRLVDLWQRSFPGQIGSWLDRRAFVYADVPYVIADRQQMVEDPRNTIAFDGDREARVHERVEEIGADGRLVVDGEGRIATVGLLEKLLVPVLAKLTSLVPGGGIWMNTQRPEWNDANNALAGFGVSMVTLYHLLGYVTWLQDLVTSEIPEGATLSNSVARWAADITRVLEHYGETCHTDDSLRRQMMDDLGAVGDGFRASASTRFDPTDVEVSTADLARLLTAALDHLRCAIDESRRPDGLVDSYNVVAFPSGSTAVVSRLGPMLEGQVAALSSGFLNGAEVLDVVDALYASGMYREDQNTFMLYPIVELPSFVDKNLVGQAPGVDAVTVDVLIDEAVFDRDANGELHFSSGMVNAAALSEALAGTVLSDAEVRAVLDMYESVFQHHRYTGRSGSMHGYEGIGSIYWHMVGKLAVSVQEAYWRAIDSGESDETVAGLADAYRRVRAGLGFCKSPTEYGAIPTDCYSHTPSHAGAQQPGMTGHVKELIITRFGELGIRLEGGILSLSPGLLDATELFDEEAQAQFSYCGIPVLLLRGAVDQVRVEQQGQWNEPIAGHELPADHSAAILSRTGEVTAVEFTVDSF